MSVNDDIAALIHRAGFVHIGNAVVAVSLFKAVFQVIIRAVYRLHDGIIQIRSVYGDPADKIIVERIQLGVLGIGRLRFVCRFLRQLRTGSRGLLRRLRGICDKLRKRIKILRALPLVVPLPVGCHAGKGGARCKQDDQRNADDFLFLHSRSSVIKVRGQAV